MNQDPFAAYRINKQAQQPVEKEPEQQKEDPFSAYRIKKSEDIPGLYEVGRHAARIGSRIAETLGGIPGDVQALVKSGLVAGAAKLVGPEVAEAAGKAVKTKPTSRELKEFSEKSTKGLTAPQNEAERIGDEIAQTAASLVGPMKFRRVLGVSLGAQLAKEGVKLSGLGEGPQTATHLGTLLMLSAMNPGGAMRYASSQYDIANNLAKGVKLNVVPMKTNLEALRRDLQFGIPTTSKNAVIKPIEDLLSKVKNDKIPVQDLTAAKRDLNTIMKDPAVLKREKKLLKVIGKEVDNAIKPYEKINPAFKNAYRPANEIYGAIAQGSKAYDFLVHHLKTKSPLAAIAEVASGHPEWLIPTAGAAAASAGIAKTSDFFVRLARSPELQKYYIKSIGAAMAEDSRALLKYAEKFDELYEKSSQKKPLSKDHRNK